MTNMDDWLNGLITTEEYIKGQFVEEMRRLAAEEFERIDREIMFGTGTDAPDPPDKLLQEMPGILNWALARLEIDE